MGLFSSNEDMYARKMIDLLMKANERRMDEELELSKRIESVASLLMEIGAHCYCKLDPDKGGDDFIKVVDSELRKGLE